MTYLSLFPSSFSCIPLPFLYLWYMYKLVFRCNVPDVPQSLLHAHHWFCFCSYRCCCFVFSISYFSSKATRKNGRFPCSTFITHYILVSAVHRNTEQRLLFFGISRCPLASLHMHLVLYMNTEREREKIGSRQTQISHHHHFLFCFCSARLTCYFCIFMTFEVLFWSSARHVLLLVHSSRRIHIRRRRWMMSGLMYVKVMRAGSLNWFNVKLFKHHVWADYFHFNTWTTNRMTNQISQAPILFDGHLSGFPFRSNF